MNLSPIVQPQKQHMRENAKQAFLQLHELIERSNPQNDNLLGGRLGLAFYFFVLYNAFNVEAYKEKAVSLLEQVYANLNSGSIQLAGNSFAGGGAGLGFLVNLFHRENLVNIDPEDDLAALDEFLYTTSLAQINTDDKVDYLHGATGTIHYFTQRLPDKKIELYLTNLVTAFCKKAVNEENGIWFRNWIANKNETGEINLSLSHGSCGLLLILINVYKAGLQLPCIRETVEKGVDFILSYQQDIDMDKKHWSFFPSTIKVADKNDFFRSQRLSWCYGDLGQALLLYRAAELLDRGDWIEKSNLIGTFTLLRKDLESTVVTETLFCHGTAGIAQFYKSLYKISGISKYTEGQEYWIDQTVTMLPGELEKALYHQKEHELLEGLVGVNLVLLSFVSEKELDWSNVFLL